MKLNIKTKSELNFYWYNIYAMTNNSRDKTPPNNNNIALSSAIMQVEAESLIGDKEKTDKIFSNIKELYDNSLLQENELIWIKQSNSRLTNWLWHLIIKHKNTLNLFNKYIEISKYEYNTNSVDLDFFDYFSFNKKAYSTKEKNELIVKLFELSSMNRNDKIFLINKLRDIWNEIITIDNLKWIISNDDSLYEWAINYNIEYNIKNSNNITDITNISFENNFDKLVLLIDSWDAHVDTKKLFIQSIKKSYAQKKFRDKQIGKKQCSFNLSQKSINQLALLSEIQGVPKNHILESLINHKILELGVKQ